jgi:ABC-type oligopeptide transport system substrate-binding subunit
MMTFRNKIATILLLALFSSVTFVSCGKKSAETEQAGEEQPAADTTEHPEGDEHPEGEEHPTDSTQQE